MNRFFKFALITVLLLALCGSGAYWYLSKSVDAGALRSADQDAVADAVALAIKVFNLKQGEQGVEFWRLKADWAEIHQEQDIINVVEPNVRYTIGTEEEEDYLYAVSKQGRITDNRQVLTMWEDVKLTRNEDVITGPLLVYTSENRQVHFPEGAHLESVSLSGLFDDLRWLMDENTIVAEGVDLVFKARDAEAVADADAALTLADEAARGDADINPEAQPENLQKEEI